MPQGQARFRTSFTSQAGLTAALFVTGTIANVNVVNWTVDVFSKYDRKRYFNIQVGSPYLHPNSGEGLYVMPEVGATVSICLPSDSAPPYVAAFLMPPETLPDTATADAPAGTRSHGAVSKNASDSSFYGGRPRAQPGDIWLKGRDGNFVILHRGGVLQFGASELAQRICIPLGNHVMDISG